MVVSQAILVDNAETFWIELPFWILSVEANFNLEVFFGGGGGNDTG